MRLTCCWAGEWQRITVTAVPQWQHACNEDCQSKNLNRGTYTLMLEILLSIQKGQIRSANRHTLAVQITSGLGLGFLRGWMLLAIHTMLSLQFPQFLLFLFCCNLQARAAASCHVCCASEKS